MLGHLGWKKMEFGVNGRGDIYFAAALILLIGIALFLSISTFMGNDGGPTTPAEDAHYQCQNPACNYEFTLDPVTQMEAIQAKGGSGEDPAMVALDCPKCKAIGSALPMTQCPSCHQWFVSDFTKNPNGNFDGVKEICPKCGVDINEFRREEWKKKHG